MKIFQTEDGVYGFCEDGTIYRFIESIQEWKMVSAGPWQGPPLTEFKEPA